MNLLQNPQRGFPLARRGMAMLLVLISLASATILSVAYLASRDNSTAISENVTEAAAARWAAAAGLDLTIAVLETNTDWRTLHAHGRLLNGYSLAGATIDVDLTDIETNDSPSPTSRYLRIHVTATRGDISQSTIAQVFVPEPEAKKRVSVDLSEFAIFAVGKILMSNNAILTRWPNAPAAEMGERIAVATQSTSAFDIEIRNKAQMVDTTVYRSLDSSSTLVVTDEKEPQQYTIDGRIPMPAPPAPPVEAPSNVASTTTLLTSSRSFSSTQRYNGNLDIEGSGTRITLADGAVLVVDGRMRVRPNTRITVTGNAKIVVFGEFRMESSQIELNEGAALEVFVRGDMTLTDAYLGEDRGGSTIRDTSGNAPHMDTSRLRIWGVPQTGVSPTWTITHSTAVKTSMYSTTAHVMLSQQAALYGRVAANRVTMGQNASIFYDTGLNTHTGYTNLASELYDENGSIRSIFRSLSSLDTATLDSLASTTGLQIRIGDSLLGTTQAITPDTTSIDQPTPRPVQVTKHLISWGTELKQIEEAAKSP